jgi:hypothetical protein
MPFLSKKTKTRMKKRTRKNRKTRKTTKKGGKQKIQTLFQPSLLDPGVIRYRTLITGNKDMTTSEEVEEYLQSLKLNPTKSKEMYLQENEIEYKPITINSNTTNTNV